MPLSRKESKIKLKDLPPNLQGVAKINDPDGFIDLLAANSYIAGDFGLHIPVDDTRRTFEVWLTRYTKRVIKKCLVEVESKTFKEESQ